MVYLTHGFSPTEVMDALLKYDFFKNYVFGQARGNVMKMTAGVYPAPLAIIDVVRTSLDKGAKAGYAKEAEVR